uniref:Transposase (Putative), gypsy type n=1 Tax=Tanacetum cinerariifolium TaxID=118510 RepID=A0A6L2JHS3_TANCI|nr:transposase (putative), gypsy type [Tanacetum cinerariifolium]
MEALHPELPGPEDRILDFPEGKAQPRVDVFQQEAREKYPPMSYKALRFSKKWNNRFFWVDERVFPTIVDWRISAPKDGMPAENTYSPEVVMILNTHRTPIQKQPKALLCLVGLSRRYYMGDEVYPTFLHDDDRDMDLFSLIRAPNPTKVKTGSHPRAAHEVPLLTVTANRVIEMKEPAAATDSSGVPSTIERSPLGFANENPSQQSTGPEDQEVAAPEVPPPENVTTAGVAPKACQAKGLLLRVPLWSKNAAREGTMGGKSLAAIELGMGSTRLVYASHGAPVDVSDLDPLSFADPQSRPAVDVTQSSKGSAAAGDPESENTSFTSMVGSPESIYRPEWGITNGCLLDAPEACQDLVDHIASPGYFLELRHLHNDDFLKQYNVNLARQVAMGSQLRLRFEHEAKLLKKSVAQTAENKSAELSKELENMRALFSDLHVSNNRLSQQVSTLQEQVMGEEKLKFAFEEFKQYEDNRVEQHCAEMDARLDALSIDFDEELYPHMLTAIAGRRWVIGRGLRLAMMKCGESTELRQAFADVVSAGIAKGMSEGLKHGVEHGKAKLDLEAIEVYDPEAEAKYIAALYALKNPKYPLVDQLESLKDAPMDVIMTSLHLENDTGDDTPQWIRELCPSSSQLTIPVYPEARDPMDPWACKEEILLVDAIAANISRVEKKKKCRVVCRTHGVGSAHHARSDGVSVSVPTVAPQGLAILLADAATQTKISKDEASPRLLRSSSLRAMHS